MRRPILDGYRLEPRHREGFVDKMIEFAIRSARDDALTYDVTEATPSPAPDGFPVLWGVTWRTKAACWILDHRSDIERAITSPLLSRQAFGTEHQAGQIGGRAVS